MQFDLFFLRAEAFLGRRISLHTQPVIKDPFILARINPFGVKMDGTPDEVAAVLEQAHAAGKGVLGMKIAGEGRVADKVGESLRFAIALGAIDAMPIGFLETREIDEAIAHIAAA